MFCISCFKGFLINYAETFELQSFKVEPVRRLVQHLVENPHTTPLWLYWHMSWAAILRFLFIWAKITWCSRWASLQNSLAISPTSYLSTLGFLKDWMTEAQSDSRMMFLPNFSQPFWGLQGRPAVQPSQQTCSSGWDPKQSRWCCLHGLFELQPAMLCISLVVYLLYFCYKLLLINVVC